MPPAKRPEKRAVRQLFVECKIEIAAPPEKIFEHLSNSKHMSQWLNAEVYIEPHVGGTLRINFEQHKTIVEGEVLELVPNKKISFSWGVAKGNLAKIMPAGSTKVTFELVKQKQGTLLVLQHIDLPDQEQVKDHEEGWDMYLQQLKLQCAV